jgi:predicted nuclease with TOPRIM domain
VSASELSYLKAEIWALQNKLKDEKQSTHSLSESFRKLANEKYELLEELTKRNMAIEKLHEKLDAEM